jgi:putative FmdB family regulatory protein
MAMPTYEFRCVDCGNRVEVFQRIGDEPLTVCEVCGGTMRKVFHPAGIVFKGSGFYATDSRSSSAKPDGKKEPAAKGSSEGSKGGKGSGGSSSSSSSGSGASSGSSDKGGAKETAS